jgi:hypothetical protein
MSHGTAPAASASANPLKEWVTLTFESMKHGTSVQLRGKRKMDLHTQFKKHWQPGKRMRLQVEPFSKKIKNIKTKEYEVKQFDQIVVNCSHNSSKSAWNATNISAIASDARAPLRWADFAQPGRTAKENAEALYKFISAGRTTKTPCMRFNYQLKHPEKVPLCQNAAVKSLGKQFCHATQQHNVQQARMKMLEDAAIAQLESEGRQHRAVSSSLLGRKFYIVIDHRQTLMPVTRGMIVEECEKLLQDPAVKRSSECETWDDEDPKQKYHASFLTRLVHNVEKRRGIKTTKKLLVLTRDEFDARNERERLREERRYLEQLAAHSHTR